MNVIAALLALKIQNALILSVNISANAIQDWIFGILKSCIVSEISRKTTLSNVRFNNERKVLY